MKDQKDTPNDAIRQQRLNIMKEEAEKAQNMQAEVHKKYQSLIQEYQIKLLAFDEDKTSALNEIAEVLEKMGKK